MYILYIWRLYLGRKELTINHKKQKRGYHTMSWNKLNNVLIPDPDGTAISYTV